MACKVNFRHQKDYLTKESQLNVSLIPGPYPTSL